MKPAAFIVALTLALLMAVAAASASNAGEVIISGGDLLHPVRLAKADEDAFHRRLAPPPKFEDKPDVIGDGYRITTAYWDNVLRNGRSDKEPVAAEATYFEDSGFVRARQGDDDVWLALDLRQRAIIDRYLRLTRAGLLRERPGVLEVLEAASRSEAIAIDVGGSQLSRTEARELWSGLFVSPRPSFHDQPRRPSRSNGAWLVFSLEEGRSIQVFYDQQARSLTDYFGSESYRVIQPVAFTLDSVTRGGGAGLAIEQQSGPGAAVWWLIMAGGGALCLGAAIWLKQRLGASSA